MVDFSSLKQRKSNSTERFQRIKEEATKSSDFVRTEDPRYWQPEVDKTGNGYAVIRFLDSPENEDSPWVRLWSHGFKNDASGKWYIENSLTTLNETDPVAELNSKLWGTGTEANKEIVRKQKRRLSYISNILVVSDAKHPENEGKVFLYKYGKKIFDKLKDKMSPPEEFVDETPMDPFNFWTGANFKLKIRKVDGFRNYDKSEFEKPTSLGTDERIKEIWENCYPLKDEIDRSHFKSYEELKHNLETVLHGYGGSSTKAVDTNLDNTESIIDYDTASKANVSAKEETSKDGVDDESLDMNYFKNLAKDDDADPF